MIGLIRYEICIHNTPSFQQQVGGADKQNIFANVSYYAQNGNLSSLDF